MLSTFLLGMAAFAPQGPGLVINELSYDDTGADDLQFVEIYNGTGATVDLSNFRLVGHDGTNSLGNGSVSLSGMLPDGGFFVIGDTLVPSVNQSLGGLSLENDAEGVTLEDLAGTVVDSVVWEFADWSEPVPIWLEGDGIQGAFFINETPPNPLNAMGRAADGLDTDSNGFDFVMLPWSPGASNASSATAMLPFTSAFDGLPGDTFVPSLLSSRITATVADPATLGIPASPQGGNIGLLEDPTGGGNAHWLGNLTREDYALECFVFVAAPDPITFSPTDGEAWTVGVRGTTDSFGDPNGIGGYNGVVSCAPSNESGQTGIGWTMNRTALSTTLTLVDYNDGGSDFTILGAPVAITLGVNDGWQRIRLCVSGGSVVANFGGTRGCDDGTRITASGVSNRRGGAYLAYRECHSGNAPLVWLRIDALTISSCTMASVTVSGVPSPTTVGTPTISATGLPQFGNSMFSIDATGLVPNSIAFGTFNFTPLESPGVRIPGAQMGALRYLSVPYAAFALVSDGAGAVSVAFPVPCNTSIDNLTLKAQFVDFDFALPQTVPVGTSAVLSATVGY